MGQVYSLSAPAARAEIRSHQVQKSHHSTPQAQLPSRELQKLNDGKREQREVEGNAPSRRSESSRRARRHTP